MKNEKVVEALVGAVVLVGAVGFFLFAYFQSDRPIAQGYTLRASFESIDGLLVGSDVRVSGVKVGSVREAILNPENYLAVVSFDVASGVRLPTDSIAQISSDGFLGGKFLSITPGGAKKFLTPGSEIMETQPSISLERMLSKFVFSAGSEKS